MAAVLIPLAISAASSFLASLLAPRQKTEGPRLNDLSIPSSSYGTPIPRGWGRFRVTGAVIWGRKIKEVKKTSGGGKGGGAETTTYTYFGSFAVLLCQGPVSGILKIWANGELKYNLTPGVPAKTAQSSAKFAQFYRFYPGTSTQEPDDYIQGVEGIDRTPAWRGFCYLVFENLPLKSYGNRLPAISVEVIENNSPPSVARIVTDLCLSAGLSASQFDVSQLTGLQATGFIINSVDTVRSHLEKLQATYLFDIVDADGKIKFVRQFQATPAIINSADLGCYEYGTNPPPLFKETRLPYKELPNEVRIKYLSADKDYAEAEEYARRTSTDASNRNVESLETAQVMTVQEAKTVVSRLLYASIQRGIEYEFFLPIHYLDYDPGRYITCELRPGKISSMLLVKKELGVNFLLRIEAGSYDASVYGSQVPVSPSPYTPSPDVANQGDTILRILDIPLVKDIDTDNGLYVAAGGDPGWMSATLFISRNNGASYEFAAQLEQSSTFGSCSSILAAGTTTGTDTTNTLSVTLQVGELVSAPAIDLDNGTNKALVGNEVIQFESAVLSGANTYTLSNLRRGRRGTEWAVDGHIAGEQFVLLTGDYLARVQGQVSDLGQPRLFKALTDGQDLADVDAIAITPVGVDLECYAPILPTGTRDPVGNATVGWTRRDRHAGDRTDYGNFPVSEVAIAFEVDIYNGTSVVRTLTASASSVIYPAVDQTTDFGSAQSTITCCTYQMSALVGRGYSACATLPLALTYPPPLITSFNPPQGAVGTAIIITGTGFTGATSLTFNNVAATFTVISDTQTSTTVPVDATTGLVTITTPGGSASLGFTVAPPPPTITSFSPASGVAGNAIIISGTNFTGATTVRFNGITSVFTVDSATQITATVPSSAGSGPIEVTTANGTTTSATGFIVNATAGGSALTISDEGVILTNAATSIDFVGGVVTATKVGGAVTVTISGTAAPPPAGTVLLMHMNRTNNGTSFIDEKGKIVTLNGSVVTSTAQSKFNGSSGYFPGNGSSYLGLASNEDFDFASGPLTWDCWVYPQVTTGNAAILGTAVGGTSGNAGLFLGLNNNKFIFRHWRDANGNAFSSQTITPNAWYFVRVTKSVITTNIYVNGVTGVSGATGELTINRVFTIGIVPNNQGFASPFMGYLAGVRVKKGVLQPGSEVPTAPFLN